MHGKLLADVEVRGVGVGVGVGVALLEMDFEGVGVGDFDFDAVADVLAEVDGCGEVLCSDLVALGVADWVALSLAENVTVAVPGSDGPASCGFGP